MDKNIKVRIVNCGGTLNRKIPDAAELLHRWFYCIGLSWDCTELSKKESICDAYLISLAKMK